MGILLMFLMIGLIILVHEYGHYRTMVRNGIEVEEFTVGFGWTLYERKLKSGTMFRIKLILLGGYAMPAGKGEALENGRWWPRLKVYSAGMIANCLAASVALAVLYVHSVATHGGGLKYYALALGTALLKPFLFWLSTPYMLVKMLIFTPKVVAGSLQGPVGIIGGGASGMTLAAGIWPLVANWLTWFAIINIAIAGMNLLPIPGLDGGRIALMPFERFLGKKGKNAIIIFCVFSLIALMLWITFHDIANLFTR